MLRHFRFFWQKLKSPVTSWQRPHNRIWITFFLLLLKANSNKRKKVSIQKIELHTAAFTCVGWGWSGWNRPKKECLEFNLDVLLPRPKIDPPKNWLVNIVYWILKQSLNSTTFFLEFNVRLFRRNKWFLMLFGGLLSSHSGYNDKARKSSMWLEDVKRWYLQKKKARKNEVVMTFQ